MRDYYKALAEADANTDSYSVTVTEGTGQLKVYLTVWGKNHESVSGETIVTVK